MPIRVELLTIGGPNSPEDEIRAILIQAHPAIEQVGLLLNRALRRSPGSNPAALLDQERQNRNHPISLTLGRHERFEKDFNRVLCGVVILDTKSAVVGRARRPGADSGVTFVKEMMDVVVFPAMLLVLMAA